jgi:hypothetical protein
MIFCLQIELVAVLAVVKGKLIVNLLLLNIYFWTNTYVYIHIYTVFSVYTSGKGWQFLFPQTSKLKAKGNGFEHELDHSSRLSSSIYTSWRNKELSQQT